MVTLSLAVNSPNVKQIEITAPGRVFTYELNIVTERCIVLTANHTGKTAQFNSSEAVGAFLAGLDKHLQDKYQPKQLPAPQIAGLLPPYAGAKPGQCDGFLNAHWAPQAVDGWVYEVGSHKYCPHCAAAHRKAMTSIKTPKVERMEIKNNRAHSYEVLHNGVHLGQLEREYLKGVKTCIGTSKGTYEWCVYLDSEDGAKRFEKFEEAKQFVMSYEPPAIWLSPRFGNEYAVLKNGRGIGKAFKKSRVSDTWWLHMDNTITEKKFSDLFELYNYIRELNEIEVYAQGI